MTRKMCRDETYIAQQVSADRVSLLVFCDGGPAELVGPRVPTSVGITASFGSKIYAHDEPVPLRLNWRERTIAHFLHERERA